MLESFFSPLDQAKYDVVHQFPNGGAVRLGPLVGIKPGTLSNKVNPQLETHHLTVDEAVAIQNAAQDFRILYAEAELLNHAAIPLGNYNNVSDVELLNVYARLHAEIGDLAESINDALDDHRITREDFNTIAKEGGQMVQAWLELRARLEGLIDE